MFSRLFDIFYAPFAVAAFTVVAVPACAVIIVAPTLTLRRNLGRCGMRAALLCMGVPLRVHGLENLPPGACIAVANHTSYLDGLILTAALPSRFTFVVQDGAAGWPLIGPTIRRMGATFVNRSAPREGAKQTRALIRRVQEGESFAVFAEGTFKAEPGLLPFKNGAFMMAVRAQVPVVPVGITGTRRLWGGHNHLPRWSAVTVRILPAIAPVGAHKEAETHLRDAVRAEVLKLCGEPDRAHAA
ncbi:MAG: lysophospholipid acyltransferase family protein, partial [Stenotrophobium sp.]